MEERGKEEEKEFKMARGIEVRRGGKERKGCIGLTPPFLVKHKEEEEEYGKDVENRRERNLERTLEKRKGGGGRCRRGRIGGKS